jgi:hypothetical protein
MVSGRRVGRACLDIGYGPAWLPASCCASGMLGIGLTPGSARPLRSGAERGQEGRPLFAAVARANKAHTSSRIGELEPVPRMQ